MNAVPCRRSTLLSHGDGIWLGDRLLRFLEAPEHRDEALESLIDQAPEDHLRAKVWADALQENGDPLGDAVQLQGFGAILEGLAAHAAIGQFEFDWSGGLPRKAVLRSAQHDAWPPALVAQLLSLRVARWFKEIVIDATCDGDQLRVQLEIVRTLLAWPLPIGLRKVTCGYSMGHAWESGEVARLWSMLAAKAPGVTWQRPLLARIAWLEIGSESGHSSHRPRFEVTHGARVSTSHDGSLALSPVTERPCDSELFSVMRRPAGWTLLPVAHLAKLNGRPAFSTRLLPGDAIQVGETTFRFGVHR